MRVQISIPPELWERIQTIAREEYRLPKHQLERFVYESVRRRDDANQSMEVATHAG